MLFILMTVSIGIYSATAARTVNQNNHDRAMYNVGADLIVNESWIFFDSNPGFHRWDITTGDYIMPVGDVALRELFYLESPIELFYEADGVEFATPVYSNNRGVVGRPRAHPISDVTVFAIYPDEFAQVSWWRDDMYDYHFNYMMNAMSANPYAVLISPALREWLGVSHGDPITVTWFPNDREYAPEGVVYDIVELFPTWNPIDERGFPNYMIVVNYELIRAYFKSEPYEVWISTDNNAQTATIMEFLSDNRGMTILPGGTWHYEPHREQFIVNVDADARIARIQNSPHILAMNGFFTLSFLMTLAVTAAGFLVFWYFEFRSRRLQIGIMRSAGMPRRGVIAMVLWEQVFLSLLPLAAGVVLGRASSLIFVPMFERDSIEAPLQYLIHILTSDIILVTSVVAGIIVASIAMLSFLAARLKISQTLKLGEE
jgi:putative ABC transport system permease protein